MKKIPFFIQLLICVVLSFGFIYGINFYLNKPEYNLYLGISIAAFAGINTLNWMLFNFLARGNHFQFNSFFLVQSFLRTIVAIGLVLCHIFLREKPSVWMVVEYFVIYFIFTLAEIIRFVFNLRPDIKN